MKNTFKFLLLTAALSLTVSAAKADPVNGLLASYGFTQDWTALSVGQDTSTDSDYLVQGSSITGFFGVAGAGQHASVLDTSSVDYAYLNSSATPPSTITVASTAHASSVTNRNLNPDISAATNASNAFAAMSATPSTYASSNTTFWNPTANTQARNFTLSGTSQSLTLTAATSGTTVLNIKNFTLSGGAVLTLAGVTGSKFVFNIGLNSSSANYLFAIQDYSKVVIQPGGALTASNVIFNVLGTSQQNETGPNNGIAGFALNNHSSLQGTILAVNRTIAVRNSSTVLGAAIAARIEVSGGASIVSQ